MLNLYDSLVGLFFAKNDFPDIDFSKSIMLGDMNSDIEFGKNAGMKTVFFKSNQGDHKSRGIEPDYIIYNFNELPRAVAFLEEHN